MAYKNFATIDNLSINTIRFLSVDMVQQANSGHPGLPLGACTYGLCSLEPVFTIQSR